MLIYVESRRKSLATIRRARPEATVIDVTSKGPELMSPIEPPGPLDFNSVQVRARSVKLAYVPKIQLGEERFKLHCGPYRTPRFRIGQIVKDEIRGEVTIVGITDGRISWPIGQSKRAKALVMFRGLVKALKNESGTAICHWWGISEPTVQAWRRKLGLSANTIGSRKLRSAYGSHPDFRHVLEAAHATLTDLARGAKISASLKGRPKPKHIREMLLAARLGSKASEDTRQKMREAHRQRRLRERSRCET